MVVLKSNGICPKSSFSPSECFIFGVSGFSPLYLICDFGGIHSLSGHFCFISSAVIVPCFVFFVVVISGTQVLGGEAIFTRGGGTGSGFAGDTGLELDEAPVLTLVLHAGTLGGVGGLVLIGGAGGAGLLLDVALEGGGGGVGARGLVGSDRPRRGGGGGVGNLLLTSADRARSSGRTSSPRSFNTTFLRIGLLDLVGPGCEASPMRPLGFFLGFCRT